MTKRALTILLAAAAVAFALPATASAAVSVSTSGGELNITSTNNQIIATVDYVFATNRFRIADSGGATTSDGDCEQTSSSFVECDDNGEDLVDVDFGTLGGSIDLQQVSNAVPGLGSDITLGNGAENVDATDGVDVVHAASISTVNNDTIDTSTATTRSRRATARI